MAFLKCNLRKSIRILVFSCLILSGSTLGCVIAYQYINRKRISHADSNIQAIIYTTPQTGIKSVALNAAFFSEILNLSIDCPMKFSQFDINEAKKCLLSTHIIREVRIKKLKPNLLFIHYTTRFPIAYIEDYTNTAIGEDGVFFPYAPFYSPRHLPNIYLGEKDLGSPWGKKITIEYVKLIENIFENLGRDNIERIDISQINATSAGKRELVIVLNEGSILRLQPSTYVQQLNNYSILKNTVLKETSPSIIDLRISELAYIGPLGH